jgi:hypothetical protein
MEKTEDGFNQNPNLQTFKEPRAWICRSLSSPGIDSKQSILTAYVAYGSPIDVASRVAGRYDNIVCWTGRPEPEFVNF